MRKLYIFCLLLPWLAISSNAQTKLSDLTIRTVISNIQVPWEMRWGPDNWIWATGIQGNIIKVNPQTGEQKTLLESVNGIERTGEAGMHGFDFVRDDADQLYVYVAYTYRRNNGSIALRVIKLTYNSSLDILQNPQTVIEDIGAGTTHSGCRIKLLPDNTLLITAGDGRIQPNPSQNVNHWSGKTLRINIDGTFPQDNPNSNSPVWSWGHRNHQGLCIGKNGTIYSSEHGEQAEDEVNILQKTANYGWPYVEGMCNDLSEKQFCEDSNVIEPITVFSPTLGIAGMEYFNNFPTFPDWQNSLILTSLKGNSIHILSLTDNGDSILKRVNINLGLGRLRSVCISPEGRVYIGRSQGDHYGSKSNADNAIVELSVKNSDIKQNQELSPEDIFVEYSEREKAVSIKGKIELVNAVEIYDITGSMQLDVRKGIIDRIPFPSVTKGMYIAKLITSNEVIVKTFLVY